MYIEWKHKKFEEILGKKIKLTSRVVTGGNKKEYDIVTFAVTDPYFKILRRFLYKNGEKRVTDKALNRLDKLGLAILYLDYGSLLHRKTVNGTLSIVWPSLASILFVRDSGNDIFNPKSIALYPVPKDLAASVIFIGIFFLPVLLFKAVE